MLSMSLARVAWVVQRFSPALASNRACQSSTPWVGTLALAIWCHIIIVVLSPRFHSAAAVFSKQVFGGKTDMLEALR